MKIMITGASGFIGSALVESLECGHYSSGTGCQASMTSRNILVDHRVDIKDRNAVQAFCQISRPEVVVHCAGLAHQKISTYSSDDYFLVNTMATENLAQAAAEANPNVRFIFMSSVSVYGEQPGCALHEGSAYRPSGSYAVSKFEAERRLIKLCEEGVLSRLDILRLAPVYDRDWTFNLDRRVLAPNGLAYLRFGSGTQRLSALARPNLAEFVALIINEPATGPHLNILNVCDAEPYSFNRIIAAFKSSDLKANRPGLGVPLWPVGLFTRAAACMDRSRADWWRACYAKLAGDLVFDNSRMLATGFVPPHSLETILGCQPGRPPFV